MWHQLNTPAPAAAGDGFKLHSPASQAHLRASHAPPAAQLYRLKLPIFFSKQLQLLITPRQQLVELQQVMSVGQEAAERRELDTQL